MYDTETRAQFINLRARGWSYNKISRHTAISKRTLLNWGQQYADDIAQLKPVYDSRHKTQDFGLSDGVAQESYFHNLEGHPADVESKIENPKSKIGQRTRNIGPVKFLFRLWKRVCRLFAALRYLMFKG